MPAVSDHRPPSSTRSVLGGRYRLLRTIARGGMATVHLARDEVLERDVAVKVLHPDLADDHLFVDRFLREARAAASLAHPNVVAVYDWGEEGNDSFLVMEHVAGPSLRGVLQERGRLTPGEASAVVGAAARGIAAAHGREIIHRDVKPENILISSEGVVKVTDFGLARAVSATTRTFAPGSLVGSPHYLSPEAVRDEPLSPAADVYALGVVLYEAVVGQPPFSTDSPYATAMAHTRERVPAPSAARSDLPPEIDAVVAQATAPAPVDRYVDADDFGAALRAAVPAADLPGIDDAHRTLVIPPSATQTVVPRTTAAAAPEAGATPDATAVQPAAPPAELPADDDAPAEDDPSPAPRRPERRRWRRLAVTLLALVAVLTGAFLAWSSLIAPVESIPDVVGSDVAEATTALQRAGFDPVVSDDVIHVLDVPEGQVLDQDPSGEARIGTAVTLRVSAGPRPVEVPDVVGDPQGEAIATIEAVGLRTSVSTEHDEDVVAGQVLRTDPAGGTESREGETVAIVVSSGPRPIDVPDVRGQPRAEAVATLEDLGLVAEIVGEAYHDTAPAGSVIGQSPAPQTVLRRGDAVDLTVSAGPEPFSMPDVRGMERDAAVADLEQRGLEVDVREVRGLLRPSGEVAEQEPSPGSTVRRGDRVTIYVWR